MAKASVDPSELRRFAGELKRFNVDLEILLSGLHGKLASLEASWRDQEQRKFAESFSQTAKVIAAFLEESRDHVSTLGKKASLIEEYLNQR